MSTERTSVKALLPGYFQSLTDEKAKERYKEKLQTISGVDPYEIPRNEWINDLELWPEVSQIHIGMYLLLTPSPYTREELLN